VVDCKGPILQAVLHQHDRGAPKWSVDHITTGRRRNGDAPACTRRAVVKTRFSFLHFPEQTCRRNSGAEIHLAAGKCRWHRSKDQHRPLPVACSLSMKTPSSGPLGFAIGATNVALPAGFLGADQSQKIALGLDRGGNVSSSRRIVSPSRFVGGSWPGDAVSRRRAVHHRPIGGHLRGLFDPPHRRTRAVGAAENTSSADEQLGFFDRRFQGGDAISWATSRMLGRG